MSRSVVARVAMSRSASLSNMCSMISYPNGPVQAKGPPGAGLFVSVEKVTTMWWLRIYLGGWLGTSDACGRSPWHRGSGRPPESAQKRGAFHREPLPHLPGPHPPYPTRYDKGHPRRSPTAARQRHRRKARPPTYPPGEGPELERNPGAQLSHPPIPRRRLVSQAGTVPTHRSRTNPTSEQKQCPRPGGRPAADRTNGDPDG